MPVQLKAECLKQKSGRGFKRYIFVGSSQFHGVNNCDLFKNYNIHIVIHTTVLDQMLCLTRCFVNAWATYMYPLTTPAPFLYITDLTMTTLMVFVLIEARMLLALGTG
mgnify:CR=1 FL=1